MNDSKDHKAAAEPPLDCLVGRLRAMARYEHDDLSIGDDAADEIERLRAGLRGLRDVVIDHNRSGADWKTPELFGRMMDALAKADELLVPNAELRGATDDD